MKQYKRIKRLGNSIVVRSNIKLFVEYTNGNLSREFVKRALKFFQPSEKAED